MLIACGQSSGRVSVDDIPSTISDVVTDPDDSIAYLNILADGTLSQDTTTNGNEALGNWLESGAAAQFDVNVVVNSGALQVGAAGTFNLGSNRQFGCENATVSLAKTANVTFNFRRAGGSTNLASKTVDFSADVD